MALVWPWGGLGVALGGFRGFMLQDTFARGRVSTHSENCWYQGHLRRMSGVSQNGTPLPPNNPICHLPGLPAVDDPGSSLFSMEWEERRPPTARSYRRSPTGGSGAGMEE